MWETELVSILRATILDLDETPKYCDSALEKLLVAAGRFVVQEAVFTTSYTFDVTTPSISPDPTNSGTLDESFVNLTVLKAACLLSLGETRKGVGNAIVVQDGHLRWDMRTAGESWVKFLKDGYCKTYKDALDDYTMNGQQIAGAAIMGPVRLFANSSISRSF